MLKYIFLVFLCFSQNSFSASEINAASEEKTLKIEKDIEQLFTEISTNSSEIASLEKQIKDVTSEIEKKKTYIAKRLLAQKSLRHLHWLLALEEKNKAIFDRNLKIFKNVNAADLTTILEYRLQLEELNQKITLLKQENKKLSSLAASLKTKEVELQNYERAQIKELVATNIRDHLLNFKGQLHLPVDLPISQKYGTLHDSDNQYVVLVKGLVFDSIKVKPVSAFGPGQVIFSDDIPYWGESLIISHKGGYFTVYSGLKNLKVVVGETVQTEQLLAETADKDFYFELRHQNVSINPLNWIRKTND